MICSNPRGVLKQLKQKTMSVKLLPKNVGRKKEIVKKKESKMLQLKKRLQWNLHMHMVSGSINFKINCW